MCPNRLFVTRLLGPRASYTSAEPIFTTIKAVNSLSHKFKHLHFGALESQNAGFFLMLKLAANSGQRYPFKLLATLFPLSAGLVVLIKLQVPAGEAPQGYPVYRNIRCGNVPQHYLPGWLDCTKSRQKSGPLPGPGRGFFIASSAVDVSHLSQEQKEKGNALVKVHRGFALVLQVLLHTALRTLREPDGNVSADTLHSECQNPAFDLCQMLFKFSGKNESYSLVVISWRRPQAYRFLTLPALASLPGLNPSRLWLLPGSTI